jgi:DNA-binding transcriptional ArsR family regulator
MADKFTLKRDILLPWDLLNSAAFRSLSAKGIQVLLRFYQKRRWKWFKEGRKKKKIIYEDGGLVFTYTEAEALGISKSQFHTILKKLYELGLIDIEYQGGGLARDYSRYSLSSKWRDYGTPLFRERTKPKAGRPGCDVRSWMRKKSEQTTETRNGQLQKDVTVHD